MPRFSAISALFSAYRDRPPSLATEGAMRETMRLI
jgi:hypothetical protein